MARNFFDSLRTVFSLWTKHSFLPFFALSGFIFHLLLYHPPLENCGFPVLKPFCSHFGNNDSENEFVKSLMNYSGLNEKTQLLEMEGKTASLIFTEGENNRLITDKMKVTVNGWMVEIGKGVEEDGELPEG